MSTPKSQWLLYAIASGACAALNGVFAKLTTTQLTTTWATAISHLFGLSEPSRFVEVVVRGVCFPSMNSKTYLASQATALQPITASQALQPRKLG
jgi:uncharacterized membrane protein